MKNLEYDKKKLNSIGNDRYLIAKYIEADFIITYDKDLLSIKFELKDNYHDDVVNSEDFLTNCRKLH